MLQLEHEGLPRLCFCLPQGGRDQSGRGERSGLTDVSTVRVWNRLLPHPKPHDSLENNNTTENLDKHI